jgi:hypothetical protein
VASAKIIDRSLVETKGKAFVERMQEALPKLPGVGKAVTQESTSGASDDEVKKMCMLILLGMWFELNIDFFRLDEDWATKTRFQYCDMSVQGNNNDRRLVYAHAYSKQIEDLQSSVSRVHCLNLCWS